MAENLIVLLILIVMSIALAYSGFKKVPGIGILLSLAGIGAALWLKYTTWAGLGFFPQTNWLNTVGLGLLLGAGIAILGIILIDPLAEKITGKPHDYSIVEGVRGDPRTLAATVALVWVTVAFIEEILFRGFFMTELVKVLGQSGVALALNSFLTAMVFGLAHWYQGRSGVLSSGTISVLISLIFIWSGFNLWLVILLHGFIDTTYLVLMYGSWDKALHQLFWKV
ncbi:MAG TPA: CPBP family intramembrane glutamic endopeptidase [Anaerolineales bacterium]|jgi:membrane protease YdiL (CAAX protease family)|nr:CPBP family intramembrane glutamic endopeptidase [Anaerolineales bacterium]